MMIGIGLDRTLNLSFEEEMELSKEAARLGYSSIWTPEGPGYDAFLICANRWNATRQLCSEGLTTGISVSPITLRTPVGLAMSAGTMGALTEGRFILGIGAGNIYLPEGRQTYGLPTTSALHTMHDYLVTVRALLTGNEVTYKSPAVTLDQVTLDIGLPTQVPVYLAALGPKMLRLAGKLADGAALNWCTTEQVAWSKEQIAEGAREAGRDPANIKIVQYIRVCVDDDIETAKRSLAKAALGYALGPSKNRKGNKMLGYRAHFERMGFGETLSEIDRMRNNGATGDEMADAFPAKMLSRVGYFGTACGAAQAIRKLGKGLDTAIVRVVAARPGLDAVRATMAVCRSTLVAK